MFVFSVHKALELNLYCLVMVGRYQLIMLIRNLSLSFSGFKTSAISGEAAKAKINNNKLGKKH